MTNKKNYIFIIYFIIFFIFILIKFTNFNPYTFISSIQDDIKKTYKSTVYFTSKKIDIMLNNSDYINSMIKTKEENQKLNILAVSSLSYINQISLFNKNKIKHPSIKKAKVVSFVNMMDYNKLWLQFDDFNSSKLYGLVYNNYAVGISVSKDNKPIAILNSDKDCSYSVHIGNKKVLGIMNGSASKNTNNLTVNYIPPFKEINIGDTVTTSGLDNIFFRGIKVGVVEDITYSKGYQKATIKPFFDKSQLGYFLYVIDL